MTARQLWVDFNDVDDRGHVDTLAKFAEPGADLSIGARLLVGDDEGNLSEAEVISVNANGIVRLALNIGTFVEAVDPELAGRTKG